MQIIINPPASPIVLSIFNLNLRYYGLILCCAIIAGIIFAYKMFSKISKEEADFFIDYIPFAIFVSIIGARIFYVTGNLKFYLENKSEILLINHGGLSIWGAILFGIAFLIIYLKKKKKNILLHFDVISLAMPMCQAIGRFGNFFNQEAFGMPTDGFLKLFVSKQYRPEEYANISYFHPTFLYESILNIFIFISLLIIKNKVKNLKQGTIFCLYIICYSTVRIAIEAIRIDSVAYLFNMPIASFISIIMIIAAVFMLKRIYTAQGN